jgi:ABC-type multidrug transport system permease subunit
LRQPDSGVVSVLGPDIRRHIDAIKQRIGVQLQTMALYQKLMVREIITLRSQGVLRRDGATALPRPTLLAAYIAMRVLIALTQTGIIFAVGIALFGMTMAGDWLVFGGALLVEQRDEY